MTASTPADPVPKAAGGPRQFAFVALCSVALVLAAFAAPPTAQGASPPDVPFSDLFGEQSPESGDCVVALSDDPVPGRNVTVTVRRRGEPVDGVRVWFDGDPVGVTNRSGQVEGRVPYVEDLRIGVGLAGGGACEFVTGTAERTESRQRAANPSPTDADRPLRTGLVSARVASGAESPLAAQSNGESNATGTYTVHETIDVGIEGRPNPGANVTLVATIGDEPVPNATVSVAGREVGTTDASGRFAFAVPDDGSHTVTVAVQRGELRSQRRVDVRVLRVTVRAGTFPVPGTAATVAATIGDDAAAGAVVTLDGERLGVTDASGRLTVSLPADPTATVTVTTDDRRAQYALSSVFAPTLLAVGAVLSLVLGGPLIAYWIGGRRGLGVVVGLAANVATGVAGYAVAGRSGAVLAALATISLLALVLAVRRPTVTAEVGESTGDLLDGAVTRTTDVVLWLTRSVEAFLDQTRTTVSAAVDDLRRYDPRSSARRLRVRVGSLPGRLVAALVAVLDTPGRIVAGLRTESPGDGVEEAGGPEDGGAAASNPDSAVREQWRAFARTVVPDRWPRRTPGEVSRRAIDAGFPRDAVVELTTVFRDVEYGGARLSDDRYRRARAAFGTLDVTREGGPERADEPEREDGRDVGDSDDGGPDETGPGVPNP